MMFTDLGLARRVHQRMTDVIASFKIESQQGRMAQELALIIHHTHQPYWAGGYVACENHMTAQEDEQDWPCDEARRLAMVLGVALE